MLAKGDSENAMVKISVQNNKSFPIPSTGEMGTYATVIIGCMLAAAGIMLRTKKENAE